MRKRKVIKHKGNPSFVVVVDGETEEWYLQMLKRNERDIRVTIKPEIPNKKNIDEQFKQVCDLSAREYTKVFWIIDFDTVLKEARETGQGKQSPVKKIQEYRTMLAKKFDNVVVIVNTPCLEFWFLLHYEKTAKFYDTCAGAETQLKRYLKDFEKNKRYFTKEHDDIYLKLKPHLNAALKNSQALGAFDPYNPSTAACEMSLLFLSDELKAYFK